jgi:hypothetical protein
MHDDPVDRYLAAVARRLRALPAARRGEELRELRQHLDALVAGHRAAGLDEQAAARAAVARFGPAERVGRGLRDTARPRRSVRSYAAFWAVFVAVQLAVNLLVVLLTGDRPDLRDPLAQFWPALLFSVVGPVAFVVGDVRRHRRAAGGR